MLKAGRGRGRVQYSKLQVPVRQGTVKSPIEDNISDDCKNYSQHLLGRYCRSGVDTIKGILNFQCLCPAHGLSGKPYIYQSQQNLEAWALFLP